MTAENGHGTSRSEFLKRTAGATAVVAGAGVGAGAFARGAGAANGRTYTAGHFELDIDGSNTGRFVGLDGGNLSNDVLKTVGSDHVVVKSIGKPKFEDCTIQVGANMGAGIYQWISDVVVKGWDPQTKRRASIVVVGSRGEEAFRRSFNDALITEITFPKLDAQSTSVAQIAVTFSSQEVSDPKPSGLPVTGAKQKAWLCSNFRLDIGGISTTSRISKVDSFTWKCAIQDDGSLGLDVGNIAITCDTAILPDFQQWLVNLQQGADDERSGALTINGLGGTVLTLGLSNLGVFELRPDHAPGQSPNGRFVAEMYCEQLTWDIKKNQ